MKVSLHIEGRRALLLTEAEGGWIVRHMTPGPHEEYLQCGRAAVAVGKDEVDEIVREWMNESKETTT
jgi:hypothetical protein